MLVLKRNADTKISHFRMKKPVDMHQHFREDSMLNLVGPMVAKRFRTAIAMPNLDTPITTCRQLDKYAFNIDRAVNSQFWPLMTMYQTDTLEPSEVHEALNYKKMIGIKFYPPGLTTNSDKGVKNPASLWTEGTKPYQCLKELAEYNGVFLIHAADGVATDYWESEERIYHVGDELDPYDQEEHFIKETLPRIIEAHPDLKISIEHMSTIHGVDFMRRNGGKTLGCSLTAHHILLDRRDVFRKGINVHRSWMPVIQPLEHKQEIQKFALEDYPFVWLGSDSAPHPRAKKEAACCASGVLMAHAGIELYAEAFDQMNALDERFERFASINGPTFFDIDAFYGMSPNNEEIELVREEWTVTQPFFARDVGIMETTTTEVVPFRLGEKIQWKLAA